ncbi:PREDICTED: tetratricopeptide repeat protein 40 [Chaetura pelagica]|uniref:tetratricopeptide repeat protein 40 n=1 Tax=Chaetura pelagica TaxID=8897 RepID=UPI00052314BE|nr:PREDICTED: tetratricopeptide repeat protein 40 [Chaetura pelagica]
MLSGAHGAAVDTRLLSACECPGSAAAAKQQPEDVNALINAYELIRSASRGKSVLTSSDNLSADVYVLCAEQAFQLGYREISSDCLQMYFKERFPVNQFLGRAYLCQGQLHTPLSTDNLEEFEKFVLFFIKAIDFALHDQRYYFLVYNASVLYWQLVRPYLRPGFLHCLIPSLSRVVQALNQTEEPDSEWRAELMINLLECFLDASKLKEAKEFSSSAAVFIKENVPDKYPQIFSLMVYHKLMDISQVEEEIQSSIHFSVIYKMQMLKWVPLIMELARFSMKVNCIKLAYDCILDLKRAVITEQGKLIEIECLEYEYEVKKMGTKIATYTKGIVEAQLELVTNLELTLKRAVQLGDPAVVQVVCATQWGLCLPLLQRELRRRLRTPLVAVADVLEEMDSSLILLRCQVHMEIACIEEDEDRLEAAVAHLQKAVHLDTSGQYQEHLRLRLNRLCLCTGLCKSPGRPEDQAIMMIEQAKRGKQNDERKKRFLLVNAGLALAPDSFQIVLDSENETKVSSGKSNSQTSYLCAKAQHHTKNVKKVDEHLKQLRNENDRERIVLWADLAKVARKQEVWDVCRAACRFCLLYDDTLFRKVTQPENTQKEKTKTAMMGDDQGDTLSGELLPAKSFSFERDLLRILAEIRFINAEATVNLIRLQGVELNDQAVPPEDTSQCPGGVSCVPESDPEWKTYSSWIDYLSQYAMENFQRAAEIGEELKETWIVHNAVVYVLNYNRHLISGGRQRKIMEYLQTLLRAIKTVGHNGNTSILLMLCNALARGLILCWIPKPKLAEPEEKAAPFSVDPSGLPDIRAALEICEFALNVATGTPPGEAVPVAAQQQIIATWVKAKQLHQQQIGHELWMEEKNNDEAQNTMERILVGLEMYSCNGLGLMDFTVPSLSELVQLALECSWSDSLVEVQALARLAYFAYVSHDYEAVMTCARRVLQSDEGFCHRRDVKEYDTPGNRLRQELLSTAAFIQGKSIMENWNGRKHLRVAASKAFVQSARYAGEARSYSLVMFAARHFWNTCLPLLGSPRDREHEADGNFSVDFHNEKKEMLPLHQWATKDFQSAEEDLTLRTSLYGLLFHIYADKAYWKAALKVLDEAIQVLPQTRHRLLIFKHMATTKARLGRSFRMDIQKFEDESEDYLSRIWRHLVSVSRSIVGQLSCFQNAITALQKQENEWQKVDYLLEFAEWLYCNQFPLKDVIEPLNWVVDLLLHMKFSMQSSQEEENLKVDSGAKDTLAQINLEDLNNIKQLEALFRAQTLMAVISGHSSPFHQQHCLMAHACVLRIWQVSLSASGPIAKELSKSSQPTAPKKSGSKSVPKKEKDKKKEKQEKVQQPPGNVEASSVRGPTVTLPANVEGWARYDCPSEIREAFKQPTNSHGINWNNFPKPTYTLYFLDLLSKELQKIFCPHLILPIFQLAEVIANEVVECRSLSNLYHLRIALICSDLKLTQASLYHEKAAGEAHISELEQAMCRQAIALKKEKTVHTKTEERKPFFENAQPNGSEEENVLTSTEKVFELNVETGKGLSALSFPHLWIEKAEVLIQLGLYQPARLLLSEAHAATQELGSRYDVSRCLYLLAVLANLERNHGQAKLLLEKAQLLGGNEQFWYNSTLALTEAILEEEGEGKQSMACEVVEHTVNVLRSALLKTPNRQSELDFIISSLEARMIAKQERNEEEKHNHYLEAYNLAQRAVSKSEEVFHTVCSLFAVNETTNISIPIMRQLANRKINLVEILLDIFNLVITEKKLKKVREASPHEIVETLIRRMMEDDATEQAWRCMELSVGHVALAQLASLQSLCWGCPDMKSKCLHLTGKTLRLLASNTDPVHSDIYWRPDDVKEHRLAQKYLSQASEALLQCLGLAFTHSMTEVLASASLEMVECFQQFDPGSTSQFLALHQSCSASLMMKRVLLTVTSDTSSSQLAALLHLQNHLKQNRSTSDLLKNVEQQLAATSVAWRNLCIPVEHFNIIDELSTNFYIIILQHSEDRSNLYSSLIKKPIVNTAQQKGKPTQPVAMQAQVSRFPVNSDTFGVLLEKVRLYKQQKMKSYLKQTVIQNLQECVSKTDVTPTERTDDDGHGLTSDFSEILEIMEEYLKPVLSQFDFSDTRKQSITVLAPENKIKEGKKKVKQKDTKQTEMQGVPMDLGLCVVLLGDALFMELPLEALSVFKEEGVSSVSRDFSLQILYNRIHLAGSETQAKTHIEKRKETKSKAHQKKNVKKTPVDSVPSSNCLPVDTRNFKYIVDPYDEGRDAEAFSPSQKIKEILEKYHDPFTVHWEGVIGNIHVPSQADWEQLLTNCSAFLFYGMERFMSHVLPSRLVAMNIPGCHLMMLLDLVRSKQSYQRIRNSSIHKSCLHTAVEGSTETAMLLSLAGVRSMLINQWFTSAQENAERLEVVSQMAAGVPGSPGDTAEDQAPPLPAALPSRSNCVLYGLPNLTRA